MSTYRAALLVFASMIVLSLCTILDRVAEVALESNIGIDGAMINLQELQTVKSGGG